MPDISNSPAFAKILTMTRDSADIEYTQDKPWSFSSVKITQPIEVIFSGEGIVRSIKRILRHA